MRTLSIIGLLVLSLGVYAYALDTVKVTVCESGCDYTTVDDAINTEDGSPRDLTGGTGDSIMVFEISGGWSAPEDRLWEILEANWTTTRKNRIVIRAVGDSRHSGTWSTGSVSTYVEGDSSIEASLQTVENETFGSIFTPSVTGTADSINVYLDETSGYSSDCHVALYVLRPADTVLLDSSAAPIAITADGWQVFVLDNGTQTVYSDTEYAAICQCETQGGPKTIDMRYTTSGATYKSYNETAAGYGAWPSSLPTGTIASSDVSIFLYVSGGSTGPFALECDSTAFYGAIKIEDEHVTLEGLQIHRTQDRASETVINAGYGNQSGITFEINHCILRGPGDGSSSTGTKGINCNGHAGSIQYFWNNLIYDVPRAGTTNDGIEAKGRGYIRNCTFIDGSNGISIQTVATGDPGDSLVIQNCLFYSNSNDDIEGTGYDHSSSDYNSTDYGTDPTDGANDRNTQSFTFTDSSSDDYHLASGDAGAKDYGLSMSGNDSLGYSDDYEWETRSGTWDIGADEYYTAPEAGVVVTRYRQGPEGAPVRQGPSGSSKRQEP